MITREPHICTANASSSVLKNNKNKILLLCVTISGQLSKRTIYLMENTDIWQVKYQF